MKDEQTLHISVMRDEVVSFFSPKKIRTFFDGTIGAGGHARALLQGHPEIELYIGCDRDPDALALSAKNLEPWKDKVELIHGDFAQLDQYLKERKISSIDGFFLISECRLCN